MKCLYSKHPTVIKTKQKKSANLYEILLSTIKLKVRHKLNHLFTWLLSVNCHNPNLVSDWNRNMLTKIKWVPNATNRICKVTGNRNGLTKKN